MKAFFLCNFFLFLFWTAIDGQAKISYGSNDVIGRYYEVRGIRMYVEEYGHGKPLLLIHGNGGSIKSFEQNIPYFAQKYRVIAVDSRAQGKTVDRQDSLSFEMMADDFAALLDKMHVDSAYVLGWSDGGINALLLALRHPGKVIKLASTGANLTADTLGLVAEGFREDQARYQLRKDKPRNSDKEKNDWKIFLLDLFQPNVPFAKLGAIQCPSLIICGDHDVIPIEHTTKIYQAIPKAYLWVVPNSGHATLREHRDAFNQLVDDFFQKPYHAF